MVTLYRNAGRFAAPEWAIPPGAKAEADLWREFFGRTRGLGAHRAPVGSAVCDGRL